MLFAVGALNYLDRAAMSVAAPLIKRDLQLDDTQMGVLFSVFFVGYCLTCFVGGWCADRFGPKRVFAWASAFWSVFCGLTAAMSSFGPLLVVRALFGLGEGPMGTTINKSISNWFPRREAGRAVGIVATGQPLGAAVAAPVIGLCAAAWGWRIAFTLTGLMGLVWLAFWLRYFRDRPAGHPGVSSEERILISQGRDPVHDTQDSDTPGVLRYILSAQVIGVAVAFFSFNYILYFLLSWLPSYLVDYQHLDIRHMAVIGAIPWLGATIGLIFGGVLADALAKVLQAPLLARKLTIFIGLIGSALCIALASRVHTSALAVALIATASLLAFLTPQTCWVLVQEIVPANRVGAAGGFVHLLANLAGLVAPSLTGWIVQHGGGYTPAFSFAAVLASCGAIALAVLVRDPQVRPRICC